MAGLVVGLTLMHLPARSPTELVIALVLADAADTDGSNVFPSIARVAALARASERTVQYAIREFCGGFLILEQKGGGRGRASRYRIDLDWLVKQPPVLSVFRNGAPAAPIQKTMQPRDERAPQGCRNGAETVHQLVHPTPDPRPPTPPPVVVSGGAIWRIEDMPPAWLAAAEFEIDVESQARQIRNPGGLRRKILERYARDGGPGKDVVDALAREQGKREKRAAIGRRREDAAGELPATPEVARAKLEGLPKSFSRPAPPPTQAGRL